MMMRTHKLSYVFLFVQVGDCNYLTCSYVIVNPRIIASLLFVNF